MAFLDDVKGSPTVNVYGFSDQYEAIKDIPIGTCATAYDCPKTGQVYILLFGQALYFGDRMKASLICPNQIRAMGNKVADTPTMYNPTEQHGITLRDFESGDSFHIPLSMDGVISYMNTRKPTNDEIQDNGTLFYWATSEDEWDPKSQSFAINERNAQAKLLTSSDSDGLYNIKQRTTHRNVSAAIAIADDGRLFERILTNRKISSTRIGDSNVDGLAKEVQLLRVNGHTTNTILGMPIATGDPDKDEKITTASEINDTEMIDNEEILYNHNNGPTIVKADIAVAAVTIGDKQLAAEKLAERWGIGITTALKTLEVTTQKGLRKVTHPVQKRFKRQPYHRKRLAPGKWFSDTTFFTKKSIINGDTCAQLTTNGKGFSCFLPIKSKQSASDGLVYFINKIGIPEMLITDGSKEQGAENTWRTNWMTVVKKYNIEQTWIEPMSWWQNSAEREIGEVKRDIRRFTQKTKSPRRLWSFCGAYVVGKRKR